MRALWRGAGRVTVRQGPRCAPAGSALWTAWSDGLEHRREQCHARLDVGFGQRGIAEEEGRRARPRSMRARRHRGAANAPMAASASASSSMPGGRLTMRCRPAATPSTLQPGKAGPQRRDQRIAAPSIERAHLPQVPIEAVTFEEIGEGQLIERRRAVVGVQFGERHPIDQRRRQQQPANPEGRRQRLAGGPEVGDRVHPPGPGGRRWARDRSGTRRRSRPR